jgi:hypothetical protein
MALIFENFWQTLYGKDLDELGVVVPRVVEEISGPKVLVTECIPECMLLHKLNIQTYYL